MLKLKTKPPVVRSHLAAGAPPTGCSIPPWTGWPQSSFRLHQSHTGWWCHAAQGCVQLSGGPHGYGNLCSGHSRWQFHPKVNKHYNNLSWFSSFFKFFKDSFGFSLGHCVLLDCIFSSIADLRDLLSPLFTHQWKGLIELQYHQAAS